jgi:hypothetical protein
MGDFVLGLLMALIVISPFLPLVFGYIARVQCENDKNECNEKSLCYLYDEGCEKFPGFKTKSGYVYPVKEEEDYSENTAVKVYHIHRAMGKPY